MKVVLIPPAPSLVETGRGSFVPFGLLSLVASVRESLKLDCEILNVPLLRRLQSRPEAAAEEVVGREPDVVGFCTWCHTYPSQVLLAKDVKRLASDTQIVFGGPQATVTATDTLRHFPWVDCVLRGEADETFPRLLEQLGARRRRLASVPGLTYRRGRQIRETADARPIEDLDTLPMPAYDRLTDHSTAVVDIGRGCPYKCYYCTTSTFFHKRCRLKSVARALWEMEHLWTQYGTQRFAFTHDQFTLNRDYVKRFCQAILDRALPFRWSCMTRVDAVDEELLELMAAAGCDEIGYGIETGSPRMQ